EGARKSPNILGAARATVSPPNAPVRSADRSGSEGGVSIPGGGAGGICRVPSFGFSSGVGHWTGGQERRPQATSCAWACQLHASHSTLPSAAANFARRTKPIVSSMIRFPLAEAERLTPGGIGSEISSIIDLRPGGDVMIGAL